MSQIQASSLKQGDILTVNSGDKEFVIEEKVRNKKEVFV